MKDSKNIQPQTSPATPNRDLEIYVSLTRVIKLTEPTADCEQALISIRYEAETALAALQKGGVTFA